MVRSHRLIEVTFHAFFLLKPGTLLFFYWSGFPLFPFCDLHARLVLIIPFFALQPCWIWAARCFPPNMVPCATSSVEPPFPFFSHAGSLLFPRILPPPSPFFPPNFFEQAPCTGSFPGFLFFQFPLPLEICCLSLGRRPPPDDHQYGRCLFFTLSNFALCPNSRHQVGVAEDCFPTCPPFSSGTESLLADKNLSLPHSFVAITLPSVFHFFLLVVLEQTLGLLRSPSSPDCLRSLRRFLSLKLLGNHSTSSVLRVIESSFRKLSFSPPGRLDSLSLSSKGSPSAEPLRIAHDSCVPGVTAHRCFLEGSGTFLFPTSS